MGACSSRIDEKVATILQELETIKVHCPEYASDLDWDNEESVMIHSCINTLKNCAMHTELKKKKKSWIKKTKSLSSMNRSTSAEQKSIVSFHEGFTEIDCKGCQSAERDENDAEDIIVDNALADISMLPCKPKVVQLNDPFSTSEYDSIRSIVLHGSALDILLRTQSLD
eukprot:758458-Hanusia_phi.AAC.2